MSPLRHKTSKGMPNEHCWPGQGGHNAGQVSDVLRQAGRLHARQPLALSLTSEADCIAVVASCCKVG